MSWLTSMSKRKNSIGRHRRAAAADRTRRADTPGQSAANAARHSGYAPADRGSPVLGHPSQHDVGHSGYAPTDSSASPLIAHLHLGAPGGMAAKAGTSQGFGEVEDGLRHTGWAPTDGDVRPGDIDPE